MALSKEENRRFEELMNALGEDPFNNKKRTTNIKYKRIIVNALTLFIFVTGLIACVTYSNTTAAVVLFTAVTLFLNWFNFRFLK